MNNYTKDDDFSSKFFSDNKGKKIIVYLSSGIKLTGVLLNFDDESILLDGKSAKIEGTPQFIYKHAISTVLPAN